MLVWVMIVIIGVVGCGNNPSSSPTAPTKAGTLQVPKSTSPIIDPNSPSAVFKTSNLRANPLPDGGANEYAFYIDVENVGGRSGIYQASYRIDNREERKESKTITVNPGQKKTLELIGPEEEIRILGQAYDEGMLEQREHIVFVGELFKTITLAERWKLSLYTSNIENAGGNITVTGDVKNISDTKVDKIVAVADIRVTDQRVMWIYKWPSPAEAPVDYLPLAPGQTSSFKIVIPNTIPQGLEVVDWRIWFKDTAGTPIRTKAGTG